MNNLLRVCFILKGRALLWNMEKCKLYNVYFKDFIHLLKS